MPATPDASSARLRRAVAAAIVVVSAVGPAIAHADEPRETPSPLLATHGWQLALSGYVQADLVGWSQASLDELDPATGKPLDEERFLVRRGRLRAEARRGDVFASLELDGNTVEGATARLVSATVGWRHRELVVLTAGLFKTPFGAEVPAAERDKPFLEPPTVARALFAGSYDAGAMASGAYGLARWSIALTNGAPVGDARWKGVDPTHSFDVVGRVGVDVPLPRRGRVVAGVSALVGTGLHPGTPPTKDTFQWVDENQDGIVQTTELNIVPGTTGSPSQTFDRDALGADLAVHWCLCALGEGVAFVEVALATNLDRGVIYADPIARGMRDLRELGVAIGVVQDVTRHAQVGVRYDRYDGDRDAQEREGVDIVTTYQRFSTLAIMAAARWSGARFVLEYDREQNPYGRGDDGAPTTRAADRVTLRAQVGF
ncbi:MAG: hypothetical protein NT062_09460 [Proteobacteria bacterium]|nr:hypothetical protein [Pseudomonadota bacterium]